MEAAEATGHKDEYLRWRVDEVGVALLIDPPALLDVGVALLREVLERNASGLARGSSMTSSNDGMSRAMISFAQIGLIATIWSDKYAVAPGRCLVALVRQRLADQLEQLGVRWRRRRRRCCTSDGAENGHGIALDALALGERRPRRALLPFARDDVDHAPDVPTSHGGPGELTGNVTHDQSDRAADRGR